MNENMLLSSDKCNSGCFRAVVYYDGNEARIWIPGLMNNDVPENKKTLPLGLFSSIEMKNTALIGESPCWVTFENGDSKRPIIIGYFGKGIRSIGGSVTNNTNNSDSSNESDTPTSPTVPETPPSSDDSTLPDYDNIVGNDIQTKLVEYAKTFKGSGLSAQSGYCQAWVADVYYNVLGGTRQSMASAKVAGESWAVSDDINNIPLGACVYALYDPHGHVAIYIGDGQVASNYGSNIPVIETVDNYYRWASKKSGFTKMCWGWNGGSSYDLTKM